MDLICRVIGHIYLNANCKRCDALHPPHPIRYEYGAAIYNRVLTGIERERIMNAPHL